MSTTMTTRVQAMTYLADEAGADVPSLHTEFHLLSSGEVLEWDHAEGFAVDRTGSHHHAPGGPVDWEAGVCKLAVQGAVTVGPLHYICLDVLPPH